MAQNHKTFVFNDVAKHNKTKDCWVIIYGKVYDVTPFMEDHPGGSEVILASTGKDGTFDFENAGHSDEARELMPKYYIGEVDQSTVPAKHSVVMSAANTIYTSQMSQQKFIKIFQFLVPVMILGLVFTVKA